MLITLEKNQMTNLYHPVLWSTGPLGHPRSTGALRWAVPEFFHPSLGSVGPAGTAEASPPEDTVLFYGIVHNTGFAEEAEAKAAARDSAARYAQMGQPVVLRLQQVGSFWWFPGTPPTPLRNRYMPPESAGGDEPVPENDPVTLLSGAPRDGGDIEGTPEGQTSMGIPGVSAAEDNACSPPDDKSETEKTNARLSGAPLLITIEQDTGTKRYHHVVWRALSEEKVLHEGHTPPFTSSLRGVLYGVHVAHLPGFESEADARVAGRNAGASFASSGRSVYLRFHWTGQLKAVTAPAIVHERRYMPQVPARGDERVSPGAALSWTGPVAERMLQLNPNPAHWIAAIRQIQATTEKNNGFFNGPAAYGVFLRLARAHKADLFEEDALFPGVPPFGGFFEGCDAILEYMENARCVSTAGAGLADTDLSETVFNVKPGLPPVAETAGEDDGVEVEDDGDSDPLDLDNLDAATIYALEIGARLLEHYPRASFWADFLGPAWDAHSSAVGVSGPNFGQIVLDGLAKALRKSPISVYSEIPRDSYELREAVIDALNSGHAASWLRRTSDSGAKANPTAKALNLNLCGSRVAAFWTGSDWRVLGK